MQRVTVRTLTLMVELLIAVVSHQYVRAAVFRSVGPDTIWLGGGGPAVESQTVDTNRPADL